MSETRIVTDEELKKYYPLVEKYLRDYVKKNWNEANLNPTQGDVALGNTGMTMNDIRQQLRMEVVIAMQKFNPNHITAEGRTVKELTFIYQHLFNRCGQLMKKLTKKRYGYGVWSNNLEEMLYETDRE
jgi:hypothetical protein